LLGCQPSLVPEGNVEMQTRTSCSNRFLSSLKFRTSSDYVWLLGNNAYFQLYEMVEKHDAW